MTHPVNLRTSVLIERAGAIAAGFDDVGRCDAADLTRRRAADLGQGAPAALHDHWFAQQAERLASLRARAA